MTADKPRWVYRFDNYSRAFSQFKDAVEAKHSRPFSQLEKQGLVQCFEVAVELAWKVMRDFLEFDGVKIDSITPKNIIRAAFAANLVNDGETWMKALEARNLMSHTYDADEFERIVSNISETFFPLFGNLHDSLSAKTDA